jgi:hypothetical protein
MKRNHFVWVPAALAMAGAALLAYNHLNAGGRLSSPFSLGDKSMPTTSSLEGAQQTEPTPAASQGPSQSRPDALRRADDRQPCPQFLVLGEQGEPLAGAVVNVFGSDQVSSYNTDINGLISISIGDCSGSIRAVFSAQGFVEEQRAWVALSLVLLQSFSRRQEP